jgi:Flp pilus assembly protein TadG
MNHVHRLPQRHGAVALEFAIVAPVTFLLTLGLIVAAMGVSSYQEVAFLTGESARWASVHGTQYAQETGNSAATAQDVYNNVIAPKAVTLDLSKLTYSVTWNANNSPTQTLNVNGVSTQKANTVTVTLNYEWTPAAYFGATTLTSTSVCTMSY